MMVIGEKTFSQKISHFESDFSFFSGKKRFTRIHDTIIVGGGPAGAYLGYCLALQGKRPIILDQPSSPEKPFLLTVNRELPERYPLIKPAIREEQPDSKLHLISPSGHKAIFDESCNGHFTVISRSYLGRLLLDNAIKNGSVYVPEKVISICRESNFWRINTTHREFCAHILVGADGVNSIVRKTVLKPYHKKDLAIGIGYYARGFPEKKSLLKFFNHRNGFLWIHGYGGEFIIGITDSVCHSNGLKKDLDDFLSEECKEIQLYKKWSALIPRADSPDFFKQPCTGRNWILIGDAAGHVNPSTGKGVLYALWSAELASQAFLASDLRLYDSLWLEEYGREFMRISNPKKRFCKPALLDNVIRYARRSKSLSNIIFDLVTGERNANSTGKRLLFKAPRILFEAAVT